MGQRPCMTGPLLNIDYEWYQRILYPPDVKAKTLDRTGRPSDVQRPFQRLRSSTPALRPT